MSDTITLKALPVRLWFATPRFLVFVAAFAGFCRCHSASGQVVSYLSFAEAKAAVDANSLPIPTPPGTVAGDLLIAAVATDGNNSATLLPPSGVGWTLISRRSQSTVTFGVWWKTATSNEPPSHVFNWTSNEQAYGWMMRFDGQDTPNPIHDFAVRGGTASLPSSPSVTTTIDNTLILRLGGFDGSAITLDSTGLSGHTTITMDRSSAITGSAASGGAGFVQQPLSGISGLRNFSLTNSQAYRTVTLAIAPFACSSGAECSDGDPCTDDVCTSGVCSNPNNTAPCSDGDSCTEGDACSGGVCVSGGPVDCSGVGGFCNTAACDPSGLEGNCDTLTPVLNGTPCDDIIACTINDSCQGGVCTGGGPPDCSSAGDQCNVASCDPLGPQGNCEMLTPVTDNTPCGDGLFCTATDSCQSGVCLGSGDPCPGSLCDEAGDGCVECLIDTDCDDSEPCTADTCNAGTCANAPIGQVTVDLDVEGLGTSVSRDVTFVITNCAAESDVRAPTVAFDAAGLGSTVLTGIDVASTWISAREGHTLRRLASLSFTGCAATVDLTGAALLRTGDFQAGAVAQDNLVDITDFSILASQWNATTDATFSTGADVTGDGLQGTADFTAIQFNFLSVGEAVDGCPLLATPGMHRRRPGLRDAPKALLRSRATRIPTAYLSIPGARRADLNDDGIIDVRDIRLFARRNDLSLSPEFEKKLDRMEHARSRRLRR